MSYSLAIKVPGCSVSAEEWLVCARQKQSPASGVEAAPQKTSSTSTVQQSGSLQLGREIVPAGLLAQGAGWLATRVIQQPVYGAKLPVPWDQNHQCHPVVIIGGRTACTVRLNATSISGMWISCPRPLKCASSVLQPTCWQPQLTEIFFLPIYDFVFSFAMNCEWPACAQFMHISEPCSVSKASIGSWGTRWCSLWGSDLKHHSKKISLRFEGREHKEKCSWATVVDSEVTWRERISPSQTSKRRVSQSRLTPFIAWKACALLSNLSRSQPCSTTCDDAKLFTMSPQVSSKGIRFSLLITFPTDY